MPSAVPYFPPMTWVCHVCGRERPDDAINVLKKPVVVAGQELGTQSIRYCNDNRKCLQGALAYSFNSKKE